MQKQQNNYAFIDSQNLYLAIKDLGWKIDYKRFRVYLKEKYGIKKAYMFIGFIEENADLYQFLQEAGYVLIFKPTLRRRDGSVKGNVDAELVLQAMIDYNNYDKAIIISGDGDFYCLVKYLYKQNKLLRVFIPNRYGYSALLRKAVPSTIWITFMNDLQKRLQYKKHHRRKCR